MDKEPDQGGQRDRPGLMKGQTRVNGVGEQIQVDRGTDLEG